MHATVILARNVLLEARRSGLPWLGLASIAAAVVLAAFMSQVALTESLQLQAAVTAALLRACGVFLVVLAVASSTAREVADKGLEFMLSLPLSRAVQYLGRWTGHAASAVLVAIVFSLPLLLWSAPAAVAHWGLSLALELALVGALALFFSMALGQLLPAVAASAGFYLLARALGTIQAVAQTPLLDTGWTQRAAQWVIDAIAFVLPRLDAVTRTDWLLYGVPQTGEYLATLGGLVLYTALLLAAGLIDLQRRNL
jgi:ABC-type transport system involved in multi-copper enzyme maturation permease subunit